MIELLNQMACVRTLYTLAPFGVDKYIVSVVDTKHGVDIEATLYDARGHKIPEHTWNEWEKGVMEKILATPRPSPDWDTLLAPVEVNPVTL